MTDVAVHIDTAASLDTFHRGLHETAYCGLRVWKLAEDLDRYRQVITATRPDVIVETGTRWGGSALWFAREFGVDVVTVDIVPRQPPAKWGGERIVAVTGSSIDSAVVAEVRRLVAGRRVMVSLDSDHHDPHVRVEIPLYGALVSPGCYLVVEDAIFDYGRSVKEQARGGHRIPEVGGPLGPIRDLLVGNPAWLRDDLVERIHPVSYYPAGWWLRVNLCPTCEVGPGRETTGMVCQSCWHDYCPPAVTS